MTKPICETCGGPMERILSGGQEFDTVLRKWVPSRLETWRCAAAFREYKHEEADLLRDLRARHADHLKTLRLRRDA